MSISRFQEKFLSPGCFTVVGVVIAGVFLLQGFSTCGQTASMNAAQEAAAKGEAVATVGGMPVLAAQIDALATEAIKNLGPDAGVAGTAQATARALSGAVRAMAIIALAEKNGVKFDDDALRSASAKSLDDQIESLRQQGMITGGLKADATPAQFDEFLKKSFGRSLKEIKTGAESVVGQRLADPTQRTLLLAEVGPRLYIEALARKNPATEAEVKASFDRLSVKRIIISAPDETAAKAKMDKALADLKAGVAFEEAMNRHSTEPALPGKTVSENVLTVSGAQFDDPAFAPLRTAKAGATILNPVKAPEGLAVYKVVTRSNVPPADYGKNPGKYRDEFARTRAALALRKELDAFMADPKNVVWKDPGANALALTGDADGQSDATKRAALLKEAIAKAKPALDKPESERFAALAYYRAVTALGADPTYQATVAADRLPAIEAVLKNEDDFDLRMMAVDLYAEAKKGAEASEALIAAAASNNTFEAAGQKRFSDVAGKKLKLKTAGLLTPEAETEIDREQRRWRDDRKADQEARAAQAAEDAKAKAEADAAAKADAAKADAGKAKAAEKK